MLGRPLAWPLAADSEPAAGAAGLAGFLADAAAAAAAELAAAGRPRRCRRRPAMALRSSRSWVSPASPPAASCWRCCSPDGAGHALGRRDLGRRPGRRGLAVGRPQAGRCRRCGDAPIGSPGPRRLARASSSAACAGRAAARRRGERRARGCAEARCVPARARRRPRRGCDEERRPSRRPAAAAPPRAGAGAASRRGRKRAARRKPARSPSPCRSLPDTGFELPGLDLLATGQADDTVPGQSPQALTETSRQLETVLDDFGVRGEIIDAKTGPVVTLYELEPAPGHPRRARHQPRRRHRPLAVRAVGARRRGAGPQRDRHRAAERAPRHGLSARAARGRAYAASGGAPADGTRQGHLRPADHRRPRRACRIC